MTNQEPRRDGTDADSAYRASDLEGEEYRREVRAKKQRKGLVIVNTGDGKGKTTAAFGIALRARGRGMPVAIIQFLKRDGANYGELRAARELGIEVEGAGDGWTWTSKDLDQSAELARAGWERAKALIEADTHAVIVLDEFTYPMTYGWVDTDEVVGWLRGHKPEMLHLVITGRDAPDALVEYADLVTEMRLVKHPFADQGINAQKGIEF
jgi:cob(I)alamin adenosyltransferase